MNNGNGMFDLDAVVGKMLEKANNIKSNIYSSDNSQYATGGKTSRTNANKSKKKPTSNGRKDFIEGDIDEAKIASVAAQDYENILKSYTEIPIAGWRGIPLGTYIRYINFEGILKTGGTVKKITEESDNSITLSITKSGGGKKFMHWTINSAKISKIYRYSKPNKEKKMSKKDARGGGAGTSASFDGINDGASKAETAILSQLGDKLLFDDSETIKNRLDMLETRAQRLEQDLKKVFILVKRLYDSGKQQV